MADTFDSIKSSFADYLSHPCWNWSWVVTQTFDPFKQKPYARLVEHSWRYFMHRVARDANINYGFYFGEPHKSGLPHWHALVHVSENLLGQPRRCHIWEDMFERYGRNCIEPFVGSNDRKSVAVGNVSEGIARYLCKYVAKESSRDQATWDFSGFMSGREADCARIRRLVGVPRSEF